MQDEHADEAPSARLARALHLLNTPHPAQEVVDRVLTGLPSLLATDTVELLTRSTSGALTGPGDRDGDTAATDLLAAAALAGEVQEHDGGPVLERLGMTTGLWVPLTVAGRTLGVLRLCWQEARELDDTDRQIATSAARRIAGALDRAELIREIEQRRRQRGTTLRVATELTGELDVSALARRIVAGVTEVTDFAVATLTIRDGQQCRRVAAAGVHDERIGLETSYDSWNALLNEKFRRRSSCFLLPPYASETGWVQTVPVPEPEQAPGDRHPWTAEHGLVVELLDEAGERAGFLSVDAPASGLLPDDDALEQLELFARQAETGLRNAWLHQELRRQRDAAEALGQVGQAISSSLDLQESLKHCCDAVIARSVGDRASVYLHDARTDEFRPVMARGPRDPELWRRFLELPPATPETTPAYAEAMRRDAPVLIEEVTASRDLRDLEIETFGVKSVAIYPLRSSARFVGVLVVDTSNRHVAFPTHEVELVSGIAAQAAVAIHQAQLHEAAQDHAARAAELYELTKEMTRTFDFDIVFSRIVSAITTRMDAYAVGLMETADDELVLLRTNLTTENELPYAKLGLSDLPDELRSRLEAGETIVAGDLSHHPWLQAHARPDARSLLIVGHQQDGELGLVLHVASRRIGTFHTDDAAFTEGLVEVAALALRNARLYEETREAAERDSLTGLKNRRMFWQELAPLVEEATDDTPVTVAVIDVDDFKAINDRHGHDVGDRALVHVADRIRRSIRETDYAYRLGGEEFTVVMPGTDASDAAAVVERIRGNITVTRTGLPAITVSAGLATVPAHAADPEGLFKAADTALYAAKHAGKDTLRLAGNQEDDS